MSSKDSGSSSDNKKSPSANNDKNNNNGPRYLDGRKIPMLHLTLPFINHKSLGDREEAVLIGAITGATLILLLVVTCICCCCCCRCCKRKKKYHKIKISNQQPGSNDIHLKMPSTTASGSTSFDTGSSGPHWTPLPPPHPGLAMGFTKNIFTYDELATATRRFDRSLLLGIGGFGYVFKGVLPNGKEVAVKSLKAGSGQGEREFQAEVEIISRVHHRHLVSLVGYCMEGEKRMLVYEFVPNRTLEYHLQCKSQPVLDCPTRLKIALGAAKGFAYLHEDCCPRVIHRDVKAANILIDNQYEAKVADFGLAKLCAEDNTHVSTRIMGTFGYVAPEYASTGKLTEKSDVFSFGVVLLELITGRKAVEMGESLIDWAAPILMQALDGGSFDAMVDPRLEGNYNRDEMHRMVSCAAACLRHAARKRPKMSKIVRVLEGDVLLDDLNKTDTKANVTHGSGDGISDYDMHSYNKSNRSSQEFSSGECSMSS
ncbi:putative protein kinase RLK-Pelle-PERK-1 family [Helianthus debilis subsp. tardiflorus]